MEETENSSNLPHHSTDTELHTNLQSKIIEYEKSITELTKQLKILKEENDNLKSEIVQLQNTCKSQNEKILQLQNLNSNTDSNSSILKSNVLLNKNDPPFNHVYLILEKIQNIIKQDKLFKSMLINKRDVLCLQIENTLVSVVQNKLKVEEKINNSLDNNNNPISYILCNDPSSLYKNGMKYIKNIILFLKRNQHYLYKILIHCTTNEEMKCLSNFVSNYVYKNNDLIDFTDNEYFNLLILLLKQEIEINTQRDEPKSFLNGSICEYLLRNLTRNQKIKEYLKKIVFNVINAIDNRETNTKFEFDVNHLDEKFSKKSNSQLHGSNKLKKQQNDDNNNNNILETCDGDKNDVNDHNSFKNYLQNLSLSNLKTNLIQVNYNQNMKEYIIAQVNEIANKNLDNLFVNDILLERIKKSKYHNEILNKFSSDFFTVIEYIKLFFSTLIENKSLIPNCLKYICKLISILLQKKYQNITSFKLNAFISVFFFNTIINSLLKSPEFNNVIVFNILSPITIENMQIIGNIIKQLLSGNFYQSTVNPYYTPFNIFFIEIMPKVFQFFDELLNCELPSFVHNIINKEENVIENDIESEIKEEFEYDSIYFAPEHFAMIYNIINQNENVFITPNTECIEDKNYTSFRDSYNKIKSNNVMDSIEQIIREDKLSNPQKMSFVELRTISLNEELIKLSEFNINDYLINLEDTTIGEQEEKQYFVNQTKNLIILCLLNIDNIKEYDFFKNSSLKTEEMLKNLIEIVKMKNNNISNPSQTKWNLLYLQSLLLHLPEKYRENDYEQLFTELLNKITLHSKSINLNIFDSISNKLKKLLNELQQTKTYLEEITYVEFTSNIQYIIDKVFVGAKIQMSKKENNKILSIVKISFDNYETVSVLKQYDPNLKHHKNEIYTIHQFLLRFPNLSDSKVEPEKDVFKLQSNYNVANALENYFMIVFEYIQEYLKYTEIQNLNNKKIAKESLNQKLTEIEKQTTEKAKQIFPVIKNYIMIKLYDKLFPKGNYIEDGYIYNKCLSLSWVNVLHFGISEIINYDDFISYFIALFNKLNEVKLPSEKMKIVIEIWEIVNRLATFSKKGEGIVDSFQLLLFIIIKCKPMKFSSNLNYIHLYYTGNIKQSNEYQKFKIFEKVKESLLNFSYKDLKNISEDEYNRECDLHNKIDQ